MKKKIFIHIQWQQCQTFQKNITKIIIEIPKNIGAYFQMRRVREKEGERLIHVKK